MGLKINNNIPAMNAARQMSRTTRGLATTMNQLASGLRINRAADDAAGLAIAERFRTRVNQYTQEAANLQTGVNAVQTAEGGLNVQTEAIGRIRELAVQAANGTLNPENREALNQEAQQLMEQINTVGEETQFNGLNLLNGQAANVAIGTEGGMTLNINASNTNTLGLNGLDITTAEGANNALNALDNAANQLSQNRAGIGAQENRFTRAIEQRNIGVENTTAAESAIRDADLARVTTERSRNEILLRAGMGALIQGNVMPQNALTLLGR
jgi:flagellin